MSLDAAALGLRIARARLRSGLTQGELAESVEIDRSAVAKIESGARRITALELARVAAALDERIEWLLQDPTPAVLAYRNTTDPGEPSPQIDDAVDRVSRALQFTTRHDQTLANLLGEIPVTDSPQSFAETELMAERARDLLGLPRLGPLHGLGSALAAVSVLAFVIDLGAESADGASVRLPAGAIAVVNGSLRTGRRRLALAHEFGHILLDDSYIVDWRIDSSTTGNRERNVDRFALALLLPQASLAERWRIWGGFDGRTREAAVRTASHFRVDMATLARRLQDLDLIDAGTAAFVRTVRTGRADIVEFDLVVADELPVGELPRAYEAAVLRMYASETVSDVRAIDLLLDTWELGDLPQLSTRDESEIWQFVS